MPLWRKVARWFTALAVVNFVIFIALFFYLGGDAWNGYAEAGHYFLRLQTKLTEVTRGVYLFSWWYSLQLMVHGVIALCIAGCWHSRE